ncbi:hypothetical protein [Pyxidicoccus sp. MSG2]|uniref:hypothetical protein n=1 Tax=Pyxidicoccus sp. MSG2 TaxID=2996790 RepID=UPI0022709417|nr:hypothetical protein [Pyxidicoccus sp. MSG2]MCY1023635.1 hypothetical protein [Pyxidicoccus sp. MSG2]
MATYKDIYKLTYVRGPSGILVMFAENPRKKPGQGVSPSTRATPGAQSVLEDQDAQVAVGPPLGAHHLETCR